MHVIDFNAISLLLGVVCLEIQSLKSLVKKKQNKKLHILTYTLTQAQMPSLYFQPCKYIAFYTEVWGAIGLLVGSKKKVSF